MNNVVMQRVNPMTNIAGPHTVKSFFVVNAYTDIAAVTPAVENAAANTI